MSGDEARSWRRRAADGTLGVLGYILSPLSWWNDAFVNIPVAYLLASLAALVLPGPFPLLLVGAYWVTNVAGLVLLHRGAVGLICREASCAYSRRTLAKDFGVSLLYTVAVAALAWSGVLAPPAELLRRKAGL